MNQVIECLTDGFVRYIDHMGSDRAICEAARVSYEGTELEERLPKKDYQLIRYLYRHKHMSPFEMATLKIAMRLPIYVDRQLVRHRLIARNEYSARYKEAIDSCEFTNVNQWRLQSSNNKQGSHGIVDNNDICHEMSVREQEFLEFARREYQFRLDNGVAREQARKDLPLSNYTEHFDISSIRGWLHFLNLRKNPHAQQEIREFADAIGQIVQELFPWTYEAFEDFELNAVTLTGPDIEALLTGMSGFRTKREFDEYVVKMQQLSLHFSPDFIDTCPDLEQ